LIRYFELDLGSNLSNKFQKQSIEYITQETIVWKLHSLTPFCEQ